MQISWLRLLAIGIALVPLGCSEEADQMAAVGKVPPHAFAIVGSRALDLSLLELFDPDDRKQMAKRVVRDELLRAEAEKVGPARARVIYRGELARRLIQELESEIRETSEITESELREEYARRWLEFDRPRALRTVQVFFPVQPPLDEDLQFANAQRVRAAVEGTHNLEQFGKKARDVLEGVDEHRVYEMPPLSRDGRIVPMNAKDRNVGGVSKHLAEAVGQLSHAGDISDVVGTEDGYHVFFVTEVIPKRVVPFDSVRKQLERAVFAGRVEQALDAISKAPRVKVERRRTDISNLLTLAQQGQ